MKQSITYLFLCLCFFTMSQSDSLTVLSYQDFIEIVKKDHPYTKQAEIRIHEGDASLLYAKGAFDPKIYTDVSQK